MSKSTRGIRAAGIASLAVTLSIGVAAPAFAAAGFELDRIAGDDRYETAVKASEQYGASDDVIIANGQPGEYADALAGNYLAGAEDAPILLTKRSGLPDVTMNRLDTIDPTNVWIVGGEAAVPADQEAELEAAGYNVERVAGDDRFGTNAEVIAADGPSTDGVGLIATGLNFPDALAAGPFAYQGHSLGLVRTNSVPDAVGDALEADGVTSVLIFGGTDVVGAGVVSDLAARGITVEERFAGADRSETSELAAEWAVENLEFSDEHVGIASGYTEGFGADALAGGPVEGNENSPMLITRNVDNPDDVIDYLENHSDTLADGHIYGGTAAISAAAEAAMEEAGQGEGPVSNQSYTVSPSEDAQQQVGTTRQYTVTGIDAATVDIALFECEEVTVAENGLATFQDDNTNNGQADRGDTTGASITVINGVSGASGDQVGVNNGSVSFTVSGSDEVCVQPVVWADANDNDQLDLNATDQPTEDFAVGGETDFIPAEAAGGAFDVNVTRVDKSADYFIGDAVDSDPANDGTFYYDANDQFRVGGAPVTMAQFEANLSAGDVVDGVYATDPALQSTFDLSDNAPAAPATATATASGTTVTVEFDESNTPTVDQYNVYRAVDSTTGDACPDFNTAGTANRGQFTQVGTVADPSPSTDTNRTGSNGIEFKDSNLNENTKYCYAVTSVDDGDESATGATTNVTTGTVADTGAPTIQDARLITDAGLQGTVTDGDVWRLTFSEGMATSTADAGQFVLEDGNGDRILIDCGAGESADTVTAADCVLTNADESTDGSRERLTVTLLEDAADRNTAGDGNVTYPLTIVTTNDQVQDLGGNVVNLTDSSDVIVDRELL